MRHDPQRLLASMLLIGAFDPPHHQHPNISSPPAGLPVQCVRTDELCYARIYAKGHGEVHSSRFL